MDSPPKKWLVRVKVLAIAYTSLCVLLLCQQQRLLFWPSRVLEHTPSLYHLPYQDVWLPVSTKDVEHLSSRLMDSSRCTIGANVSQAYHFQQLGYSILIIDYRGFGLSGVDFPTEHQVYQDAQVAWNYLTQKRQISPNQIFIYGHSLGGAIAIDLAVKHPEAAALIVQNSLTNMRDMTKRFGLFWLFPVDILLRQQFDSLQKISSVKMPVLFIHGISDPQIPYQMSQRLFAAAIDPKQLLLIPKAGQDNNMAEQYYQVVRKFMEDVAK